MDELVCEQNLAAAPMGWSRRRWLAFRIRFDLSDGLRAWLAAKNARNGNIELQNFCGFDLKTAFTEVW